MFKGWWNLSQYYKLEIIIFRYLFRRQKYLYLGAQKWASQFSCLACYLICANLLSPCASLGTWERTSRQPGSSLLGKMIKNGWGRYSRSSIICSNFGSIFYHLMDEYICYLLFFSGLLLMFCSGFNLQESGNCTLFLKQEIMHCTWVLRALQSKMAPKSITVKLLVHMHLAVRLFREVYQGDELGLSNSLKNTLTLFPL